MINCIIVDDEPVAIEIIEGFIDKIPFLKLKNSFRNPLEAIDYLNKENVDLIFLDINMPHLTGLQFLKTIKNAPLTIFTTAYSEFALDGFELKAIDYLLKPIEFDRFLKAALYAKELYDLRIKKFDNTDNLNYNLKSEKEQKDLFIKVGHSIIRIPIIDILYIEGSGPYITYITKTKKYMSLQTMVDVLESLPKKEFVRVHKSYIIALKHIAKVERNRIYINDKIIPIGNTYQNEFFKMIN